ncbi:Ankyrin-3 [Taenia crassiceps]|uniref:Ankyrin-3 n=1 Tax=Taenia crassiceps TaxID=6207 RepID=A0ABR4Q9E3_9CEST
MTSTPNMKISHIIAVLNICKRGDVVFLRKLLSSNCNFNEVKDRKGRNALHYCVETDEGLSGQAKPGGRLACAEILLDSEFKLQNLPDSDGYLPFHHAVIHSNIPLAKLLLSHGMDANALVSPPNTNEVMEEEGNVVVSGRSALHLAVIYANYEMLEFLLSGSFEDAKGTTHQFTVDVGIKDAQSATALHYAVQLPEGIATSIIKCVVERSNIDINCADTRGRTPLIWAATIGASFSTSILLELGADLCKAEKSGLTALHCASSRGHTSTVQAIIKYLDDSQMDKEERGRILDAQDTDGCPPLFYSIAMGHFSVTKKLLDAGADPKATDSRGRGPFHYASRTASNTVADVINLLLEYGADPTKVNVVDDTALHEACANSNKECVSQLLQIDSIADNLINQKNSSSQTPLQIATHQALRTKEQTSSPNAAVEICRLLVEAGANVGAEDESGTSPLSVVRSCLRNAPNYRPALELERIFNDTTTRRRITSASKASHDTSEVSSLSFDQSTRESEDFCKSTSECIDTILPEEKLKDRSSSSSSIRSSTRSESCKETSEVSLCADQQVDKMTSHGDLTNTFDELPTQNATKSGVSCELSKSKGSHSSKSSHHSSSSDLSKTSSAPMTGDYRFNSAVSNGTRTESLTNVANETQSTSRLVSPPSKHSIPTRKRSTSQPTNGDQPSTLVINSRRPSTSQCIEPPLFDSTVSTTANSNKRKASSKSKGSKGGRSATASEKTITSKTGKYASPHQAPPRKGNRANSGRSTVVSTETPSKLPSRRVADDFSTAKTMQTRRSSSCQPQERVKRLPSPTAPMKSAPLKAQHLPAWTQTSFETTHSSKPSRTIPSSDRINELARPRRRPRSCDFQRKTTDLEGKQRLPQPTITPYLMPVSRWPKTMASMLLMGEVSPLYCAQTLKVAGQAKPRKRMPNSIASKNAATERVRSAMEARVQLSMAEKDFVKLAAQVLDQYDTLLIERQKLARTRTTQQVGDRY